jgi:hypothetical protein
MFDQTWKTHGAPRRIEREADAGGLIVKRSCRICSARTFRDNMISFGSAMNACGRKERMFDDGPARGGVQSPHDSGDCGTVHELCIWRGFFDVSHHGYDGCYPAACGEQNDAPLPSFIEIKLPEGPVRLHCRALLGFAIQERRNDALLLNGDLDVNATEG